MVFIEDKVVFEIQRWSKIHLRHRRDIRPIEKIGVMPLTRIIGVREWVIGWSRIKIVNVVDWFTNILGK